MRRLRLMSFVAMVAAGLVLSACETIKGAGRDITRAGEAIEDAVDDDKK